MKQADTQQDFELRISDDDPSVAYLLIPGAPTSNRRVTKSVRLVDLIAGYQGPDVIMDFDEKGRLLGIEILA